MPTRTNILKFLEKSKSEILWSIAIILIAYFLFYSINHSLTPSNGFAAYYTASRLIVEGENPAAFYDDDYFSSKVRNYVDGIYEIYSVNLPTSVFIILPFTAFSHDTARMFWIILNLLLLTLTIFLTIRQMGFKQDWIPLNLIIIFTFQPLYANMQQAQAYVLVLSLLSVAYLAYKSNKDNLVGFSNGIVLLAKSAGNILPVLFLIQKRWKSLLYTLIYILVIFLATLPFLGVTSWLAYVDKLIQYSSDPSLSVTAHQSIYSLCYHLFSFEGKWNPHPIIDNTMIAKSLTIIFSFLVLFLTVFCVIKYKKIELAFGSFIILSLILNPASMDYHYVIILIPIFILIDWLRKNATKTIWLLFTFSILFVAIDLPYVSQKISVGWFALIAYPKLYGAMGLWGISLFALKDTKS